MTSPPTYEQLLADLEDRIPESMLRFSFSRSSGPGGQNVNKVSTRVILYFDLANSEELTDEEQQLIRSKLSGRISKEGILRVISGKHRTQMANRRAATSRFYELIANALLVNRTRKSSGIPRRVRARRLRDKKHRGQVKQLRGRVSPSD